MTETALDAAARARRTEGEARFYERILDAELFLLLEEEAEGERLRPRLFDLEDGRFVLAFDRLERLAGFLNAPAPYAAIAGRRLIAMLAGQGIGIGLNLDVAPSSSLLPADAVDWLARTGGPAPDEQLGLPRRMSPPRDVPPGFVAALGEKVALLTHRAKAAYLVTAHYDDDRENLFLVIVGAAPDAQAGIAAAVAETVRFSGEAGLVVDVAFLAEGDRVLPAVRGLGIGIEIPAPTVRVPSSDRRGPGMDPGKPPILR